MQLVGSVAVTVGGSLASDAETLADCFPGHAEISQALYFFFGDNVNGFTQVMQRIEGVASAIEVRIFADSVFGCG